MSDSVDGGVFPSDCPLFEPARALLRATTLAAWLQSRPPSSVVCLDAGSTCGQALKTLAVHDISSAPVMDGSSFLGFATASDVLGWLLQSVCPPRELSDENCTYKLRAAGLSLAHQPLHQLPLAQDGALIYKADLDSTLHDVVVYGFLRPNAAGTLNVVHRVGVFDAEDDATSEEDMVEPGSSLQGIRITHVVSQSDVVRFLHRHVAELGPLADATLEQLGLGSKTVVCVPAEMSTVNAFASMLANKVSCVGVISHAQGGGLAGSLSSSDLRGLLPEHFASLASPVLSYLTARASASWAGQQQAPPSHAVQQPPPPQQQQQQQQPAKPPPPEQARAGSAQNWGLKGHEGLKPLQLVSCSPGATLREVLALLVGHRLHRLHVLDARQRPVSIVTATDLLRVIVGCNELLEAMGPELEDEELEQAVDQAPLGECDCMMDAGGELIEGRPLLPIASQRLINSA